MIATQIVKEHMMSSTPATVPSPAPSVRETTPELERRLSRLRWRTSASAWSWLSSRRHRPHDHDFTIPVTATT